MANEINLGGTIYISSKRAAEIMGYTQDYVGQLARSGTITAKRISGLWYVLEDSLREHKKKADEYKPEPPKPERNLEAEATIQFEGREYVSASRAADLTGYHQDYVGQLARSSKVASRQVGNRWYVDRDQLLNHKQEKDALLAAVQANSVGLLREDKTASKVVQSAEKQTHLHYKYLTVDEAKGEIIPALLPERQDDSIIQQRVTEHSIPIRIINGGAPLQGSNEIVSSLARQSPKEKPPEVKTPLRRLIVMSVGLCAVAAVLLALTYTALTAEQNRRTTPLRTALTHQLEENIKTSRIYRYIVGFIAHQTFYKRTNDFDIGDIKPR